MNIYCYFESLVCIILRCLYHLNFWSNQIPKNLADSIDIISIPESCTIYLDKVYVQMKYINSLFFRANIISLITAYLSYIVYICFRYSQFVTTLLLYIIRLILSTNPIIIIPSPSNSSYNEAIYRMNRIRNNDNPYDTSIWSFQRITSILSNQKHTIYIFR